MLKYIVLSIILFSFTPLAFAQNTTLIDSYFDNLNYIFGSSNTVNVFYPVVLIGSTLLFTSYALRNRTDAIASIFSMGAVPLCIIISLMFISPIVFDYTIHTQAVEITTDIDNNVFTTVTNSTVSIPVITNDHQFRFIFSSFFSLFAIFNGLLTILIITLYSKQ